MGITDFTADKEITFYELIKRMVYQFNLEAKAGIKLINEYCRLQPYLMNRLDKSNDIYMKPIFELRFDGHEYETGRAANMVNLFLKKYGINTGMHWEATRSLEASSPVTLPICTPANCRSLRIMISPCTTSSRLIKNYSRR